ncbi:calcium-dependent kinase (macronuclear) [Tetrahymena thermophila SB210]|uniref:Calcium-dependent kinase n=1 Tax=Tetrahymena thermophila (strain SB210) TaxID=312017 RepID=Q23T79_TETTS|nr:calcium-dependent kinase [Tetrahymena thermophila SB210]EAR99827.2 calcium-dependent kinase [Tetrahymena thermophila SB210]|eukprot:XP_001020072.2 calcium-dependent kinase [Tetrahymena thermophila SB210]
MGCGITRESEVKESLNQRGDGSVQKVSDIKVNNLNFIDEASRKITDDYEISEIIYFNKFGHVKKVVKKDTKEERVMKIVNKKYVDNSVNNFNITNEIIYLSQLSHPNIIKAYEYYKDSINYYFIFEFVDSGSLIDRIIECDFFSEKLVKTVAKQVLEVLAYIHNRHIVHRDITLKNILMNSFSKQQDLQIKIIDWGNATNIQGNENLKQITGELHFRAPEVLSQSYSYGCDIWSLGVVIYTLIEGEVPFVKKTEAEIIQSIKNESLSFSSSNWENVTIECKQIVQSMLQKDHKKRPKAVELLENKWFSDNETDKEITKNKFVENMTQFQAYNVLQQATISYIATHQISQFERSSVAQLFQKLDTNHTGSLSKEEIAQVCKLQFGQQLTESQINDIFEELDIDKSGNISYNEFITIVSNKQELLCEENVAKAFKYFDKDNSGFITQDELKRSLGYSLISKNEKVWEEFMSKCDLNGDNKISFDEFKILVKGLKS